jgi:tetratricopeptide (TPR) repeat protein
MLNLPEGRRLVRQAVEASEKSGDRLQKFSLEANLGVFLLDSGEPERARAAFERSAEIIRGAEAGTYHQNLLYNLGELALLEGDYDQAHGHFVEAERRLDHTAPHYAHWLINAGLGTCALESGRLAEARVREAGSGPTEGLWHFDPTVIVDFRVRYLTRRGEAEAALALVESSALQVKNRLTQAWLKLKTIEGRVANKLEKGDTAFRLAEPTTVAEELQLTARARILRELASRGGSRGSA